MSRSGTNKRRALDRRGSLALETAFVASAFLLMLLGSFEIGRYFFVSESIKYLVGELARGATVAPEKNWDTEKAAYVSRTRILKLADFETLDVVVTPDAAPMPTTIRVTAVYPYRFSLRWLSALDTTIRNDVRFSVVVAGS